MKKLLLLFLILFFPVLAQADPLNLVWDAVTTDVGGNPITGVKYHLYRSANGGSWKLLATREGTWYTWFFPTLGKFTYRVTAFNDAGESLPSTELRVVVNPVVKVDSVQPAAMNEKSVTIEAKGTEDK